MMVHFSQNMYTRFNFTYIKLKIKYTYFSKCNVNGMLQFEIQNSAILP